MGDVISQSLGTNVITVDPRWGGRRKRLVTTGTTAPVHTDLDVLQEDASSPLVLEGQELLGMLPLLLTVLLEEVGEAWKGHVVTGEVKGL